MNLLSIIIPFYNPGCFFKECLLSILTQQFIGLEVICIDDGSTDDSNKFLAELKNKFLCLKLIKNKDKGAGSARNLGLRHSNSHFIFFMDADDVLNPKFNLEKAVNYAFRNSLDILIFEAAFWKGNEQLERIPWCIYKENLPKKRVFSSDDIAEKIFNITGTEIWNKFYRRDFIFNCHIRFQNIPNANDVYFSFLALAKAKRISCLYEIAIKYRIHAGSTQANKKKSPKCILEAISALFKDLNLSSKKNIKMKMSFDQWMLSVLSFNFNTMNSDKALIELLSEAREVVRVVDPKNLDKKSLILLGYIKEKKVFPRYLLLKEIKNPTIEYSSNTFFPLLWFLNKIKLKLSFIFRNLIV